MSKIGDDFRTLIAQGRSFVGGLLLLAFAAWLTPATASADMFVRCVQNQLSKLGFDPGPADGAIGPRTRAALAGLTKTTKSLRGLPPLQDRWAVTWCREIGLAHPRAKVAWPSRDGLLLQADTGEGSLQRDIVIFTVREVEKWYAKTFGLDLASRTIVVASGSPGTAIDRMQALQRQLGVQVARRAIVAPRCAGARQHVGFVTRHMMVICLKAAPKYDRAWVQANRRHLAYLIAHEYFHLVQAELAADKVSQYFRFGSAAPKRRTRPSWLVEGSADQFALRFVATHFGINFSLDQLHDNAAPHRRSLSDIARTTYFSTLGDYAASSLAAALLAQRSGTTSLVEYWRLIGRGQDHDAAFKRAFGMSRGRFEQDFERLRRDSAAAAAY